MLTNIPTRPKEISGCTFGDIRQLRHASGSTHVTPCAAMASRLSEGALIATEYFNQLLCQVLHLCRRSARNGQRLDDRRLAVSRDLAIAGERWSVLAHGRGGAK